jgi:hypothetical protein
VLNRVAWAKLLSRSDNPWSIQFLNDDGTEVEKTQDQFRKLFGARSQEQIVALDVPIWDAIRALPVSYELEPSDELLLDAYGLLPQVGPAIVLAYSAIETRIARALDRLAALVGLNPVLWEWINDRGNFIKDPSTAEQLDVLAKALIGKSLKEEANLWEGYQNLRQARNGFVHSGKATIGKLQTEVDSARANELVQGAERIIDWIESLLPQTERRPRFQSPNGLTVTRLLLTVPDDFNADAGGANTDSPGDVSPDQNEQNSVSEP